jgi:beta-xylosidase
MRRNGTILAASIALGGATALAIAAPKTQKPNPAASRVWVADNGDGTYKNPVLHADYSDPDVLRDGNDFYLVASSFNAVPGLPILTSRDLVNWSLAGHVLERLEPASLFDRPQHGSGAWAPSFRKHDGTFYVYFSDPDAGMYVTSSKAPLGPFGKPELVKAAKGWIDPCPFWDEDGNAYLVNAFAASRTGVKSILAISRMSKDGKRLLDDGVLVFDGHARHPTIEGPKLYKRKGFYYISAPAGGVPTGWQLVLRSKNIYGPYEDKVVLAQGKTAVNGPHQGALVDTPKGETWFLHFQDRGAYGRVTHLQPVKWVDDWPVFGSAGEPIAGGKKPQTGNPIAIATPAESDEFGRTRIADQWQWQANPQPGWAFPSAAGYLRLPCAAAPRDAKNLWDIGSLLLQKFPAPAFTATTKLTFTALNDGERAGLVVFGQDYASFAIKRRGTELALVQVITKGASSGTAEREAGAVRLRGTTAWLRTRVQSGGRCDFAFSEDGTNFTPVGEAFTAQAGRWVGAKIGLFAQRGEPGREVGYADFDWFRIE